MSLLNRLLVSCLLMLTFSLAYASNCGSCAKENNCPQTCDRCCGGMGGVQYCDSSAGRLVCKNGAYSSCYCDRHAVMDLDHLQGCCVWQGGVLDIDSSTGMVVCNNGGISEVCTLQDQPQSVASF